MKKKTGQTWNAESRHQERKDRLAELRGQNSHHHPVTARRSARSWITILVAVVVLLAILTYGALASGLPQRVLPIMTVDGQKITVAQFNYWYGNLLSQYGLTTDSEDLTQTLSTDESGAVTTVYDYLLSVTATQLQRIYTEASLAKEAGIELGEYQSSVDSQIDNIIQTSGSAGLADMMLKQAYGPGCTLGAVRTLYEHLYLAQKYATLKTEEPDVSADSLNAYYNEHLDEIDQVSYRAFTFSFSVSTTATAAEAADAKTAAKTKADAFLAGVKNETTFQDLALAATAEADREAYKTGDKSLVAGKTAAELTAAVSTWAFDDARKAGDRSVIENSTDFTVVYFIKREKPVAMQSSVRHILIEAARDTATEAEIAAAKAKAEGLLAQVTTEDSFVALVRGNSADTGSVATGGLYTGLDANASYVPEFLDWSIDPARKTGDTGIVQTDYGFHIMYFVGQAPAWEITVRNALQGDAYETFITGQLADARFDYALQDFASRFII